MRIMDYVLQDWRARMARPWIVEGARILDIGCSHGKFLRDLGNRIGPSIGYDPEATSETNGRYRIIPELFSKPAPFDDESFDVVVMLATLEHIRDKETLSEECFRLLTPGGRIVITVPSPWVDPIVHMLCRVGLADGMSLDEHHGFDPRTTPDIFAKSGFVLMRHRRFQLGLNHLYVLQKPITISEAEEACQLAVA